MGYLRGRGDYYAGDYYAGSFLGNLWRGIKHTVGGAIHGFITGGPVGAIGGAIGGAVSGTEANIAADQSEAVGSSAGGRNPGALIVSRPPPGGIITQSPLGTPVSPAAIAMQMTRGVGMRKLHPNKSTYITRGGGTSRWPAGLQVHVKGTEQVPSRRMNVANPRALRRALRRVAGFGKIVKRSKRAISMAANAIGVRHHARKAIRRR